MKRDMSNAELRRELERQQLKAAKQTTNMMRAIFWLLFLTAVGLVWFWFRGNLSMFAG